MRYATRLESAAGAVTAGVSAASTMVSNTPTPPGSCERSPPTWAAMKRPRNAGKPSAASAGSSR